MEKISLALSSGFDDKSTLLAGKYVLKAGYYRNLYNNIKQEFQKRYTNKSGLLEQDTQTAYLLALKLNLFSTEAIRWKAIVHLLQMIDYDGKLNTGFVGTGTIMTTLSDVGLIGIAYNLLLQRKNPSWLYSVDQGATTIWERWNSYTKENGFHPDIGMNSFNHYAYRAVAEWMYRYVAGINPDEKCPGFKHIILNPFPDLRKFIPEGQKRITQAEASYDSYYGKIRSAWKIETGKIKYDVTIPANTTATLSLLAKEGEVFESGIPVKDAKGIISVRMEDRKAVIELASGSYLFEVLFDNETLIDRIVYDL